MPFSIVYKDGDEVIATRFAQDELEAIITAKAMSQEFSISGNEHAVFKRISKLEFDRARIA